MLICHYSRKRKYKHSLSVEAGSMYSFPKNIHKAASASLDTADTKSISNMAIVYHSMPQTCTSMVSTIMKTAFSSTIFNILFKINPFGTGWQDQLPHPHLSLQVFGSSWWMAIWPDPEHPDPDPRLCYKFWRKKRIKNNFREKQFPLNKFFFKIIRK